MVVYSVRESTFMRSLIITVPTESPILMKVSLKSSHESLIVRESHHESLSKVLKNPPHSFLHRILKFYFQMSFQPSTSFRSNRKSSINKSNLHNSSMSALKTTPQLQRSSTFSHATKSSSRRKSNLNQSTSSVLNTSKTSFSSSKSSSLSSSHKVKEVLKKLKTQNRQLKENLASAENEIQKYTLLSQELQNDIKTKTDENEKLRKCLFQNKIDPQQNQPLDKFISDHIHNVLRNQIKLFVQDIQEKNNEVSDNIKVVNDNISKLHSDIHADCVELEKLEKSISESCEGLRQVIFSHDLERM